MTVHFGWITKKINYGKKFIDFNNECFAKASEENKINKEKIENIKKKERAKNLELKKLYFESKKKFPDAKDGSVINGDDLALGKGDFEKDSFYYITGSSYQLTQKLGGDMYMFQHIAAIYGSNPYGILKPITVYSKSNLDIGQKLPIDGYIYKGVENYRTVSGGVGATVILQR